MSRRCGVRLSLAYAFLSMNTRALVGLLLFLILGAACSGHGGGDAVEVDPAAAMEMFDTAPAAGSWPRARLNIAVLADPQGSRAAALRGP
jgi:hypothetical protein